MIIPNFSSLTIFGVIVMSLLSTERLSAQSPDAASFPKIMGMNIGNKNYDDAKYLDALSRPNVTILGFYPGWKGKGEHQSMQSVVRALKQQNPKIIVGQYTILSETQDSNDRRNADSDRGRKLDKEGWWLLNEKGIRVQWTEKYNAFETNITQWVNSDENGLRYPEWVARRDHHLYFRSIPEFGLWYFDNALSKPSVKSADWNRDGKDDTNDDPEIARSHRMGHVAEWALAHELRPDMFLMGNTDDLSSAEFSGKLHGAFLEGLIGVPWSIERWQGWETMMKKYRLAMKHTSTPHLVGFNVHGKKDDYQRMRYGLTSCLLDNGFFSYTDEQVGYSSVPWFDEYDVKLGQPIDLPPTQPWQNGVYRRNFENGVVLVNPGLLPTIVMLDSGYQRIKGSQAPDLNNGTVVSSITLRGKDGILLIKREK